MNRYFILQIILTVGLLVLIGFVIAVLIQLRKTLRTFDELLTNINQDVPSVLSKLQLALDGVNTEMEKVEQLVSSFQEVSDSVQNTTGFVQRAVATPFIRVAGLASGAGAIFARLVKRDKSRV